MIARERQEKLADTLDLIVESMRLGEEAQKHRERLKWALVNQNRQTSLRHLIDREFGRFCRAYMRAQAAHAFRFVFNQEEWTSRYARWFILFANRERQIMRLKVFSIETGQFRQPRVFKKEEMRP